MTSKFATDSSGIISLVPVPTGRNRETVKQPGRWYRRGAVIVLTVVAAIGATLSWSSLYLAASTGLGTHSPEIDGVNLIGAAFPLLLDALILGASLRYVGGVKAQRPVAGWRVAAHTAIAATVAFNAASAETAATIPWHIVAPAVWSLIVELYARDVLGELREVRHQNAEQIPARLWISAPAESVRTKWRMLRTGETSASTARIGADRCAAARDALRRALPGREHAKTRREITRRLWAGSIAPADVFEAIGWTGDVMNDCDPDVVLRSALRAVLGHATPSPKATSPAPAASQTVVPGSLAGGVRDDATAPPQPPARQLETSVIRAQVRAYREQHPDATQKAIADALNVSVKTVQRALAA